MVVNIEPADVSWAAYVAGHPERLPRGDGPTWADVELGECRRVTRNWRRWQRRQRTRVWRSD